MNSKSKSWSHIRDTKIKCRVQYFKSDLEYVNSGKTFKDVATVAVVLWNDNCRYVGIAQCSPSELNRPEKGREIAAGRALKSMLKHIENPGIAPTGKFIKTSGTPDEVLVYGKIPETINELEDRLVFDTQEA